MNPLREIPEVAGLDGGAGLVRIPQEIDVPVTRRVQAILDTPAFRRLARISQLGLVSLVYPAAHHTRFEHSLGVYRLALLYLRRLSYDPRFAATIGVADAELFLAAALLHDVGHWPFCHPIEDLHLGGVPKHEQFAEAFLLHSELADVLRREWNVEPQDVLNLLEGDRLSPARRTLRSLLSGPIDIDKMDYLFRDSLHAGVPYGRNFDQGRLIGSLCLDEAGTALAITEKGKTAAELMVFARYVMFSEVYWHHAVRAATAMLQRAFFAMRERLDLEPLFRLDEGQMIERLLAAADPTTAELLGGLFGPKRQIYKRLAQYNYFQGRELYERMARRPYPWLAACAERLAARLAAELKVDVAATDVLIDAPPVHREVEMTIAVHFPKEQCYRPLAEVSPVVHTLARQQFDDYVKRVRVFIHPRLAKEARALSSLDELIGAAIDAG